MVHQDRSCCGHKKEDKAFCQMSEENNLIENLCSFLYKTEISTDHFVLRRHTHYSGYPVNHLNEVFQVMFEK